MAQFGAFVLATGYTVSDETLRGRPDHTVVAVSWPDALAYCRWLENVLLDWPDTPAPIRRALASGGRITLPTEAEWENPGVERMAQSTPGEMTLDATARTLAVTGPHQRAATNAQSALWSGRYQRQCLGVDPQSVSGLPLQRSHRA